MVALFQKCIVINKKILKVKEMIYLDNTTDEQDIYIPIDRRVEIDNSNNNE